MAVWVPTVLRVLRFGEAGAGGLTGFELRCVPGTTTCESPYGFGMMPCVPSVGACAGAWGEYALALETQLGIMPGTAPPRNGHLSPTCHTTHICRATRPCHATAGFHAKPPPRPAPRAVVLPPAAGACVSDTLTSATACVQSMRSRRKRPAEHGLAAPLTFAEAAVLPKVRTSAPS